MTNVGLMSGIARKGNASSEVITALDDPGCLVIAINRHTKLNCIRSGFSA
jgi:hypothetical protein